MKFKFQRVVISYCIMIINTSCIFHIVLAKSFHQKRSKLHESVRKNPNMLLQGEEQTHENFKYYEKNHKKLDENLNKLVSNLVSSQPASETSNSKVLRFDSRLSGKSFAINGSLTFTIEKPQCSQNYDYSCQYEFFYVNVEMNYRLYGNASATVTIQGMDANEICLMTKNLTNVVCNSQYSNKDNADKITTKVSTTTQQTAGVVNVTKLPTTSGCFSSTNKYVNSFSSWICPRVSQTPCVNLQVTGDQYKIGENICP